MYKSILEFLKSLHIHENEYVVFGSGPMFAHGIRPEDECDDIDIFTTTNEIQRIADTLEVKVIPANNFGGNTLRLMDNQLELFDSWGPGEWDLGELVKRSDLIDGVLFASLMDVIEWKETMGREKDTKHVQMIKSYLEKI